MADLDGIRSDLGAEHDALDAIVSGLSDDAWDVPTPAEPWSVRDQISHLAFFDELATAAATSADDFMAGMADAAQDVDAFMNGPLDKGRAMRPAEVLDWWRTARADMIKSFEGLDPAVRIPWYGPPMSPASFMTARLMETWAHGQDVVDGLGIARPPTLRLRHVAHIGVRARPFSYSTRGLDLPAEQVRVDLSGPGGERWTWNEDATQRISGGALDFCLVVTQRRHVDDTALTMDGPLAREWMAIAQAYAGPPGTGRAPGQFSKRSARA
ncbi:MAG TPA: TIGR03084 family metal-binding protein [Actinomycetota bacterium]